MFPSDFFFIDFVLPSHTDFRKRLQKKNVNLPPAMVAPPHVPSRLHWHSPNQHRHIQPRPRTFVHFAAGTCTFRLRNIQNICRLRSGRNRSQRSNAKKDSDQGRKESEERRCNPLTKLIFKATPTSRQTIGWLDPPNNTGLWLLLRNFSFGFLHFVLPQPHPFLLLMILQGRKESEERQCNPLTKLIFKATPTSRQTIGWLDPPNNTGLWLLLRNFRFGFLHFVLPQPDPFLLLMILQAITV